jgi:hypothetical protein
MGRLSDQRQRERASPRSPTTDGSGASSAAAPQPGHRRLRELADGSPQVRQSARLQRAVDRATGGSARAAGMPAELKRGVEGLSGQSMGDVTVYYDSPRPARLHAHAYTQGTDIHVGPGQERYLAHEAWHVVQQKQGRVAPTLRSPAGPMNTDTALEREADTMGARAASGPRGAAAALRPALAAEPVIQGHFYEKTYAGAVAFKEGDAGDDMVYSGASHDDNVHGELRVYYKKTEWMQRLLDEVLEQEDTYIEGTDEGNENRACFNWALFGFDDADDELVWPEFVYQYFRQPQANHTTQWINANVPADKGRQWMLDNKADLDGIVTSWSAYDYSDDMNATENNLGASKAIFAKIIAANGFEISENPTPYEICMHYTVEDGVTFEHVWLRVNGHVIETFPYTPERQNERGETIPEKGIKDIGLGGGEQSHDGMSVMRFYVTSLKSVQVDHIIRALNDAV